MDPQAPNIPAVFTESPTPPPVPKDNHWITILSMAVFVLLSLGAVAFLYYQNQQLKSMLASYQTPVATSTPTATPDPTANWETYVGILKDYSFKHPTGLKSDTGAAGAGFESIRFTFIGPIQTASGRIQTELSDGYAFSVTKLGSTFQFDPKTEIEKQAQNSKENCTSISTVSNTVVAGINAFHYSGDCLGTYTTTYLSDDKNTYSITQIYTNDSYRSITEQILSTFKFNEATNSASPTPAQKACTMEAKLCPDGSSVGRTGPNCEFTACPTSY